MLKSSRAQLMTTMSFSPVRAYLLQFPFDAVNNNYCKKDFKMFKQKSNI